MFSKSTYINRRNELKKQFNSGILLFMGNEELGMNYTANVYHFRQDSSFLYYFGIDQPSLAGAIDLDSGEEIIFGDELSMDDIIWVGPQESLKNKAEKVGIQKVKPYSELENFLKNKTVHFLPIYQGFKTVELSNYLGLNPLQLNKSASESLIKAVVAQRSIKSNEEIEEIEKAVLITNEMHLAAMKSAKTGMTEAQVYAEFQKAAYRHDVHNSFPTILSINGQTLHNHSHSNVLKEGKLLLVDGGAESKLHYAGDMTRTFPVNTKFSEKQKAVYEIALKANVECGEALMPGKSYKEIHLLACKIIAKGLKDLGLMKGNTEEAVANGAHALFFPHGLGHMMGLDVHDMEGLGENYVGYDDEIKRSSQFGLAYLRLGKKLEPGFVLTVEPGIYFIPELIDKWRNEGINKDFINFEKLESYKDFGGIRIEDDYLITENGSKLFGNSIAKTVEEIEVLRG